MRALQPRNVRHRGFTLTELMVVILIIGLLIGILIPAVNSVRNQAKITATNATMQTLSTGLETFRSAEELGGAYPPSWPDSEGLAGLSRDEVFSPYNDNSREPIRVTGAGLLVWGLMGADQLGTPGFRQSRSGSESWQQDMDATDTNGAGLYALEDGEPKFRRFGPFVDQSKVKLTETIAPGQFVVPAEAEVFRDRGQDAVTAARPFPMFLDSFDGAILYFRADPAGRQLADRVRGERRERGIYHWVDNGGLISGEFSGIRPLEQSNDPNGNVLEWVDLPGGQPSDQVQSIVQDARYANSFARYIINRDVKARPQPHNADGYILISAGPDGRFGTSDDITNFPRGE